MELEQKITIRNLFEEVLHKLFRIKPKEVPFTNEKEFMSAKDHLPPTLEFPSYKKDSMGFRMGPGETYYILYDKWLNNLSEDDRKKHLDYYKKYEGFMNRD